MVVTTYIYDIEGDILWYWSETRFSDVEISQIISQIRWFGDKDLCFIKQKYQDSFRAMRAALDANSTDEI